MLLSRNCYAVLINKGLGIKVKESARFDLLPSEALPVFEILIRAGQRFGAVPTLTGADRQDYPAGGVHQAGYAWDVRVFDVKEPARYASFIAVELQKVSRNYRVLYGDAGHLDHIHVAWMGSKRLIYNP